MKPIELSMRNFGPFENETIDFEKLGSMFLVRGNTGSGKTTIFDAISYALYGKYTGARQSLQKKALRSHFAPESAESYVTFTFSVDGAQFRIQRTLPSTYTNRNGKESQKESVVTLEAAKNGEWISFPGKNNETDAKIEKNIIKLPFDEFNKIVVLPQGEFAKFLRQNSTERSETLKKIFPLENITKTVEAITAKTKEVRKELSLIENQISRIEADSTIEEIEKKASELKNELEAGNKEFSALSTFVSEKKSILSETDSKIKKIEQAREIEEKIKTLKSQEKEIAEKSRRLKEAKKAQDFVVLIAKTENLEKHAKQIEEKLLSANLSVKKNEEKVSAIEKHSEEIAALEEKNKDDEKKLSELEKKLTLITELEAERKNLSDAKSRLLSASQKAERTKNEKESIEKNIIEILAAENDGTAEKTSQDSSSALRALLEKKHEKETCEKEAENIFEKAENAKKAREEALKAAELFSSAEKEYLRAEKNLSATKEILSELEERQRLYEENNRAAVIALTLKKGVPCPVCGSTEHPSPAKASSVSLSDKIESQKENKKRCEKEFEEAQRNFMAAKARAEEKKNQAGQFEYAEDYEKALRKLESAKAERKRASESYDRAKKYNESLPQLTKRFSEETEIVANEAANVSRFEGSVCEKEKNVGKNDNLPSVQKEISLLRMIFSSDTDKISDFKKKLDEARNSLISVRGEQKQLEEASRTALEEKEKAIAELSEKIKLSDFESRDEIKKNSLSIKEQDNLQNFIENWKSELKSNETLFESLKTAENMEELKKTKDEIQKNISETESKAEWLLKENQKKSGELANFTKTIDDYKKLEEKRREISGANETLILLSKDLTGDNPKNIQFADWILAMHLAEVIDYANIRLHELSMGRYQFTIEKTTNRGNHGLDIAINDAFTGQNRNPATLSGGETFQASISLALAMTDTVESHSGGIKLESLFIDEGFGTLDSAALKTAVAILKKIEMSNKKVGIISHVEALQGEIPSQISVERGHIEIV